MLVDCPPQPVALAVDLQLHFVQMPFVTYASLSQQLLDVAQVQAEAVVEPYAVADDLGRETIASVLHV